MPRAHCLSQSACASEGLRVLKGGSGEFPRINLVGNSVNKGYRAHRGSVVDRGLRPRQDVLIRSGWRWVGSEASKGMRPGHSYPTTLEATGLPLS
jgi:hypothetical protein